MSELINYKFIADAESYYTDRGYFNYAVPWVVGFEAYSVTKPVDNVDLRLTPISGVRTVGEEQLNGYLPASGEQSLIHQMLKGNKIYKGFCTTPCFRYEKYDDIHHPWFMKTELIATHPTHTYLQLLTDAVVFYSRYLNVDIEQTELGFDIVSRQRRIELGSYGTRAYKDLTWQYGTGVAEPRLTQAMNREKTSFYDLSTSGT